MDLIKVVLVFIVLVADWYLPSTGHTRVNTIININTNTKSNSIYCIGNTKSNSIYSRPKKKLLAFSFANFEMTRGNRGMANVSLLSYFLKFKLNKRGVSFFGECI